MATGVSWGVQAGSSSGSGSPFTCTDTDAVLQSPSLSHTSYMKASRPKNPRSGV